jgi:phosphoserine phosphatase RsbU/P
MQQKDPNSYLPLLIRRILNLDATAYQEYGQLFGPQIRDHLRSRGLPLPQAEELAIETLHVTLGEIRRYRENEGPLPEWIFSAADRVYAGWIARLCALHGDLQAAAMTQEALFPDSRPELPGLEAFFLHRPLRVVTGDFCEITPVGTATAISMGDASGKGASAALYGTVTQSWLRLFQSAKDGPARVLFRLDEALRALRAGSQYSTLLHSHWQPEPGRFVMASAGSPSPVLLRDRSVEWVRLEGKPLGWHLTPEYAEVTLPVHSGDLVLYYSDGITEQPDGDGECFGEERFGLALRRMRDEPLERVAWSILTEVEEFRGATEQYDDQSVLAMRVK